MAKITAAHSMSLDGFITGPDGGAAAAGLHDLTDRRRHPSWANPAFTMARPSAEFFDEGVSRRGAVIAGRRTYDLSQAWGGRGPIPGCRCSSSLITFPARCRPASGRTYSAIKVMLRAGPSGVADGEAGAVGDGRGLGAVRGARLQLLSRSDSTLRGHVMAEVAALQVVRRQVLGSGFDGVLLIPAFLVAGRLTAADIHWARIGPDLRAPDIVDW